MRDECHQDFGLEESQMLIQYKITQLRQLLPHHIKCKMIRSIRNQLVDKKIAHDGMRVIFVYKSGSWKPLTKKVRGALF